MKKNTGHTFNVIQNELQGGVIKIKGITSYFCVIGEDTCLAEYEIKIKLKNKIPDYDSFAIYINEFAKFKGTHERFVSKLEEDILRLLEIEKEDIEIEAKSLDLYPEFTLRR